MNITYELRRDQTLDPEIFPSLRPPTWTEDAACRGINTDLFFPTRGENDRSIKRLCHTCLVQHECLIWGLRVDKEGRGRRYGIYGGLTPKEREARYPLRELNWETAA